MVQLLTHVKSYPAKKLSIQPRNTDGFNLRRHRQRKLTTSIGIWNIQGLRNKQQEILSELIRLNIDIAILSETKKKGNGNEKCKNYIHFYSGVEKSERARAGVSIMINRRLSRFVKSWDPIDERISKLTINWKGRIINIIAVYAPNEDAPVTIKDKFENTLRKVLEKIHKSHEIVMGGEILMVG